MTRQLKRRMRKLPGVYRHIGTDEDGLEIMTLRRHLRRLVRAERQRNLVRNPTPADHAAVARAESKRERRRARNLEAH